MHVENEQGRSGVPAALLTSDLSRECVRAD